VPARRDTPVCPHGRPLWCTKRHREDDPRLGEPLCVDCYDYTGHVVWQWYAPELWRRFTIALQRHLARQAGLSVGAFRRVCKISYSKVVEFQARGEIHVHVPIRLDGPDGPAPDLSLTTKDLENAITTRREPGPVDSAPLEDGRVYQLRWGAQVDPRTISQGADRDTPRGVPVVHPEQVASYLAKYLTKATEDFGLPAQVRSAAHAHVAGASPHAVRIIATAQDLVSHGEEYGLLLSHLGTLGYRGHPITKSRAYSVTFGQIRRARRRYRSNPAGLAPDADIRQLLDDDQDIPDGFELVSSWS
jgi:Replication initiator protein, pSAM2